MGPNLITAVGTSRPGEEKQSIMLFVVNSLNAGAGQGHFLRPDLSQEKHHDVCLTFNSRVTL